VAARIRRTASRHADLTLAGLALTAIAGVTLVAGAQDRLGLGEGGAARTVEIRVSGDLPVRSAPFQVALDVTRARLEADASVERVTEPPVPPAARRTSLRLEVAAGASAAETLQRLRETLDAGNLEVTYGGGAAELEAARDGLLSDLPLLLLALPVVALLLLWALGPGRGVAALIATCAASFGAATLCLAVSLLADLSVLALAGAACGGLTALFRFAADPGADDSGPPVAPALASAAVLAAPAAMGTPHLGSFALGASLAALLAIPVSALAAPAAAALWGPFGQTERGPARLAGRVEALLRGRPRVALLATAVSLAAILLLALPAAGLEARPLIDGTPVPDRIWAATAIALAAVALAGFFTLGSLPAAVLAALSAALAPAAAIGVAVLGFQDGGLDGVLGIATSPVSTAALVAATATVAACAALAAVGVSRPATVLTELTGAALALALAGSGEPFLQQFGVASAAGLLADLVLVRTLMVPAVGAVRQAGRVRGRWPMRRRAAAGPTSE
jgi:hypothetical protein